AHAVLRDHPAGGRPGFRRRQLQGPVRGHRAGTGTPRQPVGAQWAVSSRPMTLDITGTGVNYAARAVKVSKIYGEGDAVVRALDSVTIGFPNGRFTAIMGPSGSGKSTLMHCLAGLDAVTSGNVFLGSTDLSSLDDKALTQLRRDQVGFIFQAYNLLPTLTALENMTLPLDLAGRKPDQGWLDRVIDTVGLRPRLA